MVQASTLITLPATATVTEAALAMRDADTVDAVVTSDGRICGVITDHDIVVRAIADGRSPDHVTVGEICTVDPVVLAGRRTSPALIVEVWQRVAPRLDVDGPITTAVALDAAATP
jgi:CBS domain-containing protein